MTALSIALIVVSVLALCLWCMCKAAARKVPEVR